MLWLFDWRRDTHVATNTVGAHADKSYDQPTISLKLNDHLLQVLLHVSVLFADMLKQSLWQRPLFHLLQWQRPRFEFTVRNHLVVTMAAATIFAIIVATATNSWAILTP